VGAGNVQRGEELLRNGRKETKERPNPPEVENGGLEYETKRSALRKRKERRREELTVASIDCCLFHCVRCVGTSLKLLVPEMSSVPPRIMLICVDSDPLRPPQHAISSLLSLS
jgi:hypothetical protein